MISNCKYLMNKNSQGVHFNYERECVTSLLKRTLMNKMNYHFIFNMPNLILGL